MRKILALVVSAAALTGCARRYRVEGMVLAVAPAERTVVVSHRAIPGYMPAMAMPFRVRHAREIERLAPGDRVQFRLVVGRAVAAGGFRAAKSAIEGLGEDGERFTLPVPPNQVAAGAPVPDFELADQQGRAVRLSEFAGRLVAVNFIYTRCPLPEVCPRLSAAFAAIERRFRDRLGRDLVLLSITLDPRHDTSEVLARYAGSLRADPEGWRFLTGTPAAVEAVASRFGLVYWAEEGAIVHTSATVLISRCGRLAARIEGSSWPFEQLADLISYWIDKREEPCASSS